MVVLFAAAAVLLAACSSTPAAAPGTSGKATTTKPEATFGAPSGLLAGGQPQPNGVMWLLAESGQAATLQELNLDSGKIQTIVPESTAAKALVQSPSGVVAVGVATGATGAVELHNGSSGAMVATVPVGAPVKGLAAGADGTTLYVLNGNATSASVTLVNLQTDHTSVSVPVPLATTAIAVQPTGQELYALTAAGTVDEINVGNGSVTGRFSVGSDPVQLAISSSGSTLFVLKRAGSGTNVGVVQLATERQVRVVAAPAGCVDIQLSEDGQQIYDVVGTATYGNVQVFPLSV